jgi:hypothetical protein
VDTTLASTSERAADSAAVGANPGHEISRTEYRTEFTENRTEFTETKKFGSLFGSEFPGTEFTEVNTETEPNLPNLSNLPEM